ncbi:hypothetical protein HMPREF2767_02895 [Nosocomiicoccus sp. HMSC067E10]|uniref:hypothetical protein n=1 Tax=Nosocomiicoccus sp. HMSC067E10 TaxID=1739271 RepID=UPI0008A5AB83|nr:hypothetical protein [Nosocomiicoccus sp. HMSC067E10]OFL47369.1 hypothetical protein HMPREF2767_02895 [Nosocomiicoccus sp. HMSC067E10]
MTVNYAYEYFAEYLLDVLSNKEDMDWSYVESELPLNKIETELLLQELKAKTGIKLYFTEIHLKYVSTLDKLYNGVDKGFIEIDYFIETRLKAIEDLLKALKLDLRIF